ncbi:hypothetical protein [Moraxella lacunata]|uniref:hypothetical protein n=1 Tax=Moraxella lacunata TaxID=477 RepID=UPI003EE1B6C1
MYLHYYRSLEFNGFIKQKSLNGYWTIFLLGCVCFFVFFIKNGESCLFFMKII